MLFLCILCKDYKQRRNMPVLDIVFTKDFLRSRQSNIMKLKKFIYFIFYSVKLFKKLIEYVFKEK